MLLQHFFVPKIAHSSYLLAGAQTCAIIDPRRDIDVYVDAAKSLDMKITHILETHLHADFISGHLDLAEKTGATICAPKSADCRFEHVDLAEGDTFEIEDMALRVFETPGHTPEHISYVVTDTSRGEEPVGVFCGDTLFVGDVGRPDLFPGKAKELASSLYESLHEKLLTLPDFCEVYPAHGAGSLCGRAMGAKWRSTIGYEKKYNAALQIKDRHKFIESLTTNMPPAPDHFNRCSAINGKGPTLVRTLPKCEALDPADFKKKAKDKNLRVLDIRDYDAFGGQHVEGSYHIDFGGNFATFAGWVLPQDVDLLLVAHNEQQAEDAVVWLRRVGIDRVVGYLDGSMYQWSKEGFPSAHIEQVSVEELHEMVGGDEPFRLVDVRAPAEYESSHIEHAINIPAPELRTRHKELDPEIPTVLICSTGHRSSLGCSILKQHGFGKLVNTAGGMSGYSAAGYGVKCTICSIPHGPNFLWTKSSMKGVASQL